jgi:NhaA family Na+:H+ antiporter
MIARILRLPWLILNSLFALPIGCLIALVWANLDPLSYFKTSHALALAVNDVGMALFFGVMTKHVVEETLAGGVLHSWRRALVPVVAAAGGVAASVAVFVVFLSFVEEPMLTSAWPVTAAADVALCFVAGGWIFGRHAAVPFLVALALASNAIGLTILALTYPARIVYAPAGVTLIVAGMIAALALRRLHTRSFWPYLLIAGSLCWAGLFLAGVHPALALVMVVPFMPHARHDPGLLADPPAHARDTLSKFERFWAIPVQIVLFLFGLVNAGVPLHGLESGVWALPIALFVGRPIGVLIAGELAVRVGLYRPSDIGWRQLLVIGFVASTGFAMALFFSTGVLSTGPLLLEMKTGALLTGAGVFLAWAAARVLGLSHRGPLMAAQPQANQR